MIRVSKFYKDSKEGKFISSLDKDTRTLYDTFRKGAKESSKWLIQDSGIFCFV
jgi:long-chain acyl-CoA synthetase